MKKGKYEGTNPIEKLHRGEPWFFLRAQDRISVEVVKHYSVLLQTVAERVANDKNLKEEEAMNLALSLNDQASEVAEIALKFLDWQRQNPEKVKYPD